MIIKGLLINGYHIYTGLCHAAFSVERSLSIPALLLWFEYLGFHCLFLSFVVLIFKADVSFILRTTHDLARARRLCLFAPRQFPQLRVMSRERGLIQVVVFVDVFMSCLFFNEIPCFQI
jgi:hypothetical protein